MPPWVTVGTNQNELPQAVGLGGEATVIFFRCLWHLPPPQRVGIFAVIFFSYIRVAGGLFPGIPPPSPHRTAVHIPLCACFCLSFSGGEHFGVEPTEGQRSGEHRARKHFGGINSDEAEEWILYGSLNVVSAGGAIVRNTISLDFVPLMLLAPRPPPLQEVTFCGPTRFIG